MPGVKICGITNLADALLAVDSGADALGFILAPSPRRVTGGTVEKIARNLPPFILKVGVITPESGEEWLDLYTKGDLDLIQVHGRVNLPDQALEGRVIITMAVGNGYGKEKPGEPGLDGSFQALRRPRPRAILLDTYKPGIYGGTGEIFAWEKANPYMKLNLPVILAGGLRPDNIKAALEIVRPAGVDVSSGVESAPGKKDPKKVSEFIQTVRSWEDERRGK